MAACDVRGLPPPTRSPPSTLFDVFGPISVYGKTGTKIESTLICPEKTNLGKRKVKVESSRIHRSPDLPFTQFSIYCDEFGWFHLSSLHPFRTLPAGNILG